MRSLGRSDSRRAGGELRPYIRSTGRKRPPRCRGTRGRTLNQRVLVHWRAGTPAGCGPRSPHHLGSPRHPARPAGNEWGDGSCLFSAPANSARIITPEIGPHLGLGWAVPHLACASASLVRARRRSTRESRPGRIRRNVRQPKANYWGAMAASGSCNYGQSDGYVELRRER